MGEILFVQKKYQQALEHFYKAIEFWPKIPESL